MRGRTLCRYKHTDTKEIPTECTFGFECLCECVYNAECCCMHVENLHKLQAYSKVSVCLRVYINLCMNRDVDSTCKFVHVSCVCVISQMPPLMLLKMNVLLWNKT